ncbi:HEAT repeat domain-containing protein [Gemmatimonas sp.]|jgi:epoxyqueuosine reductase|uniref:HEAT repeat domain-containing protein n=1 Tax=Gemmatimonas sp. TaxID=1962908 RepID=UPI0022BD68E3|nr:HEAT repeat domain-containing protein [Gemmatimonas sp.]MCZ8205032.1 HEAT repeat domain-containing protein [Gemmatimonas sp.]
MMTPADHDAAFKGSAIKRAKRWMLQRNACMVLGNIGAEDDVAVLAAMSERAHEVVREHAARALARRRTSTPRDR